MQEMDENGDGVLQFNEFVELMRALGKRPEVNARVVRTRSCVFSVCFVVPPAHLVFWLRSPRQEGKSCFGSCDSQQFTVAISVISSSGSCM